MASYPAPRPSAWTSRTRVVGFALVWTAITYVAARTATDVALGYGCGGVGHGPPPTRLCATLLDQRLDVLVGIPVGVCAACGLVGVLAGRAAVAHLGFLLGLLAASALLIVVLATTILR